MMIHTEEGNLAQGSYMSHSSHVIGVSYVTQQSHYKGLMCHTVVYAPQMDVICHTAVKCQWCDMSHRSHTFCVSIMKLVCILGNTQKFTLFLSLNYNFKKYLFFPNIGPLNPPLHLFQKLERLHFSLPLLLCMIICFLCM